MTDNEVELIIQDEVERALREGYYLVVDELRRIEGEKYESFNIDAVKSIDHALGEMAPLLKKVVGRYFSRNWHIIDSRLVVPLLESRQSALCNVRIEPTSLTALPVNPIVHELLSKIQGFATEIKELVDHGGKPDFLDVDIQDPDLAPIADEMETKMQLLRAVKGIAKAKEKGCVFEARNNEGQDVPIDVPPSVKLVFPEPSSTRYKPMKVFLAVTGHENSCNSIIFNGGLIATRLRQDQYDKLKNDDGRSKELLIRKTDERESYSVIELVDDEDPSEE